MPSTSGVIRPHTLLDSEQYRKLMQVASSFPVINVKLSPPGSASYAPGVEPVVHKSSTQALAPEVRRHLYTARRISGSLPVAVLYRSLKYLETVDRVAASQVCRNWRACALGSPHVWSDVTFSWCDVCADSEFIARSGPDGLHKLGLLRCSNLLPVLFSRSAPFPWTLHLAVTACMARWIAPLMDSMGNNKDRLAALTLRVRDPRFPSYYQLPQPLPKLTNLKLEWCHPSQASESMEFRSSFDSLRCIDFGGAYSMHGKDGQVVYMPELTRLRCGFNDFDQLKLALLGCPKLGTLNADLSHFQVSGRRGKPRSAAISGIRAHVSGLHTVTVLHITETSYWFINDSELFHCPEVKHLFLGYDFVPKSRACDGLAILDDLRDSTMQTKLVFSDNETAFVYAANRHERTRTVLLQRCGNQLSDICGIHTVSITSLVFNSDSWFRDKEDELPVFPSVRKVTITDPNMFAVLIDLAESKSSTTRPCPQLQDLALAGKSDSKPVDILYSGAVRLIRALKGDNAIIRTLHVGPGIVLRGDAGAEFDGMVHNMICDLIPA